MRNRLGIQSRWSKASLAGGGLLLITFGCVPPGSDLTGQLAVESAEVQESSPLALMFQEASDEWAVPVDLLKAIAYRETNVEFVTGEVEFEGQPAPFGFFALRGDQLERAATLLGVDADDVRTYPLTNIRAGAALLSSFGDATVDPDQRYNPFAWGPAVESFSQLEVGLQSEYAFDVLRTLAEGAAIPIEDGTTLVVRRYLEGDEDLSAPESLYGTAARGLGASGAVWLPSPHHSSRSGSAVQMVIIHTCEGAYSGCVSWLRDRRARVSAHYVVKEDGNRVAQLVDENRKAWHIGASYRSRLNGGSMTHLEGQSVNKFSIGIEHGGRASQRSWPPSQIARSVSLVRDITARHNIPRDRYHIVGHGQLQPESRSDPGPNWPWNSYLQAIGGSGSGQGSGSGSGSGSSTPSIVTVDNETPGRFRASSSWGYSSWASGRVGANYRYRGPRAESDTADFKVAVPAAGRYEVFARAPGNGYNTGVPFVIHHRSGRAIVHRDLSDKGASWVSLGRYDFDRVDDWIVQVSCWTSSRGWIIADAVRLVPR